MCSGIAILIEHDVAITCLDFQGIENGIRSGPPDTAKKHLTEA